MTTEPRPNGTNDGARSALVIATSVYDDETLRMLRAPVRDAEDLTGVLGHPDIGGFAVTSLVNRALEEVRIGAEQFLKRRNRSDMVVRSPTSL